MTGDLNLDQNSLKWDMAVLKRFSSTELRLRNQYDTGFRDLAMGQLKPTMIRGDVTNPLDIRTRNNSAYGMRLLSFDTAFRIHLEFKNGIMKMYSDLDVASDSIGSLLIDRTTATKYRLYVDDGVLGIEAV